MQGNLYTECPMHSVRPGEFTFDAETFCNGKWFFIVTPVRGLVLTSMVCTSIVIYKIEKKHIALKWNT